MSECKITTRSLGNGWFTAEINDFPLIGNKGNYSRYPSRKDAREAAEHRISQMTENEKKELDLQ